MTEPAALRATRRGAVGGVLAGLLATGCDAGSLPGGAPSEGPTSPSAGASATPPAEPDADTALVADAVADLGAALALVVGTARARPQLAAELSPWRLLHAAHLEALEATAGEVRPDRARGPVAELRTEVRRRELTLQRRLADHAVAARSGALAALFGSMSAAVAQQLAAEPVR